MAAADQREMLVQMAKQSYVDELFAGTSGNLSVFDPATGIMTITPGSVSYTTMTGQDAVCMRLDGQIVSGRHKPSSEWRMHASVYSQRPDVRAVVHTHSPYATSFAVTHKEIPVILIEMVPFLGGEVPVSAFALPGTAELGQKALRVLKQRNACLLANHGVLTIGDTLQQAHIRAIYVEDAAKIYALARGQGEVRLISQENIAAMKSRMGGPKEET